MIKQTRDSSDFFKICDKLVEVKNCKLSANVLYGYLANQNTFTYVSSENDKPNGYLVLRLFKDNEDKVAMLMTFSWIDAHYPKLFSEFSQLTDNKAKEEKASRIYFVANRNEKMVERKTGKYGYKKAYSTYVKEVI